MSKLSAEAKVGLLVLGSSVILLWMTMMVGKFDFGKPKGYVVTATFDTVSGLDLKAAVRMAGVSGRLTYHQGMPVGSSADYALCLMCHTDTPFKSETSTATNFGRHGLHIDAVRRSRQDFEHDGRCLLSPDHLLRCPGQRQLHVDRAAHVSCFLARVATDVRRRARLLHADELRDAGRAACRDRGRGVDRRRRQVGVGANVDDPVARATHQHCQLARELRGGGRPAVERVFARAVDLDHNVTGLVGLVVEVLADGKGNTVLRKRGSCDDGRDEQIGVAHDV